MTQTAFSSLPLAPSMLAYLDNAQSVGPDSPAGQRGKRGFNENFARKIKDLTCSRVYARICSM